MSERRAAGLILVVAMLIAAAVASAMLSAGFQHNPQGEFFDMETGRLDWPYAVGIWLSWFVPVFLVGAVPAAVVAAVGALSRR